MFHLELSVPFDLQCATQCSTRAIAGNLVFLSSWGGTQCSSSLAVGPPLELFWGNSSLVGM